MTRQRWTLYNYHRTGRLAGQWEYTILVEQEISEQKPHSQDAPTDTNDRTHIDDAARIMATSFYKQMTERADVRDLLTRLSKK